MSLQTYAGSDLNKISRTLQSYLDERELKPGDMVKYRLLNGTPNIDRDRKKGDDVLFPAVVGIPLRTIIYDPGYKDESGKTREAGTVQIGVVKFFDDRTKQPVFEKYYVQTQKGDGGIFFLRGGVIDEMNKYDAIELSNLNKSNPFRDQTIDPVFERIDDAKESKVKSTKRNFLLDSLVAIRAWTAEERRIIGASYNLSSQLDADVLKDRLEEIAEKDPATFYKHIDSEDTKIRALIKLSQEAGIISFNAHENKWTYTGSDETLALLDRKEGVSELDQLGDFLKNSANGPVIRGTLYKLLKKK